MGDTVRAGSNEILVVIDRLDGVQFFGDMLVRWSILSYQVREAFSADEGMPGLVRKTSWIGQLCTLTKAP